MCVEMCVCVLPMSAFGPRKSIRCEGEATASSSSMATVVTRASATTNGAGGVVALFPNTKLCQIDGFESSITVVLSV